MTDPRWRERRLDALAPGALSALVAEVGTAARACGALQPISSRCEFVESSGIRYVLRVVDTLLRKDAAVARQPAANPFLPYDPALYVAHALPRHVLLLNKYPVVAGHLLIVTEDFEPQHAPLDVGDFDAALRVLDQSDALVFYNGGRRAGGTQPHKHLQAVPRTLVPGHAELPVEAAIEVALVQRQPRADALPFPHAVSAMPSGGAAALHEHYVRLLAAIGLDAGCADRPCEGYNWLMTRRWLMAVPRCGAAWEGVGINALGFAGTLLLRSAEAAERVRQAGPDRVLGAVCGAATG